MYTKKDYERAAEACGYELEWFDTDNGPSIKGNHCIEWNPAESDSDCFRAMVDAGIQLRSRPGFVTAVKGFNLERKAVTITEKAADHDNDIYAATRAAVMNCLTRRKE